MKDFLDILKELIPTVIIIAGFLLPVFLKKKKEEEKRRAASRPGGTEKKKRVAGTELEDKVRRYFEEMKREKRAGAGAKPAVEAKPGLRKPPAAPSPRPPGSGPTVVEPAVPVKRKKKPPSLEIPRSGGIEEAQTAPLSSLDRERPEGADAYSLREESDTIHEDAYAIDEEVHRSGFEDIHGAGEIELSSYQKGEYPTPAKESAADSRSKALASRTGRSLKRGEPDQALPSPPLPGESAFPGSLSLADLRRAVILKEVLERPVGLHGCSTDALW